MPQATGLTATVTRAPPGEGTRDPEPWLRGHWTASPEPKSGLLPPVTPAPLSLPHLFTPILAGGKDSRAGARAKFSAKEG